MQKNWKIETKLVVRLWQIKYWTCCLKQCRSLAVNILFIVLHDTTINTSCGKRKKSSWAAATDHRSHVPCPHWVNKLQSTFLACSIHLHDLFHTSRCWIFNDMNHCCLLTRMARDWDVRRTASVRERCYALCCYSVRCWAADLQLRITSSVSVTGSPLRLRGTANLPFNPPSPCRML